MARLFETWLNVVTDSSPCGIVPPCPPHQYILSITLDDNIALVIGTTIEWLGRSFGTVAKA